MQKKSVGILVIIAFLIMVLVACGEQSTQTDKDNVPSGEDKTPPVLMITSGEYLESTSNTITIEGQLKDDVGIKSFMYSLNGGDYKDILTSLNGESFRFVVEGLREDSTTDVDNRIEIIAADEGHQMRGRVFANIVPFPDVFGRWQDLEMVYEVCGKTQKAKLLMTFAPPKQNGSVSGFGTALFNNQAAQLQVDATVDNANIVGGKVELIQGGKAIVGELRLELNGQARFGSMSFAQWPCSNGTTNVVSMDVTFSKNWT